MKLRLILALLALALAAPLFAIESFVVEDRAYGHERKVSLYRSQTAARRDFDLYVFIAGDAYFDDLALQATIDTLTAEKKIRPIVAAGVDITERPAEITNRAKFADFVSRDLMPALAKKLGGLPKPARVTIAGFSFGGVSSAYVAFRHPELFGNVLSQSGAFWRGPEGASEPKEWLTQQLREKPRRPIRFYVEVGEKETQIAPNGLVFIDANRHLRDVLASKKYTFEYVEVPNAVHNPDHWRDALGAGILYLSRAAR